MIVRAHSQGAAPAPAAPSRTAEDRGPARRAAEEVRPAPAPAAEEPAGAAEAAEAEARLRADVAAAEEEGGFALFDPLAELCIHLVEARRRREALPLAARLVALLRAHRPSDLRRRGAAHHLLGQLLCAEGDLGAAELALRRALRCLRRAGAGHEGPRAQVRADLAELREVQGRGAAARRLFHRALAELRDAPEQNDREAIDLRLRLSRFHDRAGDARGALRWARRAARRQRRAGEAGAEERRRVELTLGLALSRLGRALIEEGRCDEAEPLAEELARLDPAQGYDLLADVHEEAGRPAEVLRALQAGTRAAPEDWELWLRLGDACAAQSLFGEADHAYAQALRCQGVAASLVHYRAALNSHRRERPLDALCHMEQVRRDGLGEGQGHIYWEAQALRLALCRQVGRGEEAEALGRVLIEEATAPAAQEAARPGPGAAACAAPASAREEAAALLCLGRALYYARGAREAARACAMQSFRCDGRHLALGLLREVDALPAEPRRTQFLRIFTRLRIEGGAGGPRRARREYVVLALSLDEALAFVRALEGGAQDRLVTLELLEWSRSDAPAAGLRGVHVAGELEDEPEAPDLAR